MSRVARLYLVLIVLLGAGQVRADANARLAVMLKRADWLVEHGQRDRAIGQLRRAMQMSPAQTTPVARFAALALPDADDRRAWTPNAALMLDAETVLSAIEQVAARDDSGVGGRADSLDSVRIWALALARPLGEAIELWLAREPRLSREHAEIGRKLAALAVRREDLLDARRVLEACIRVDAEDHSLRSDLAAVELASGNVDAAVLLFRDVALARPDDLDAQRDFSGALLAAGDALSAMGLLHATRGCTQLCDCALELTRAALAAGHADIAVEAAGHSLRACPPIDPEPALWLGAAEQAAGHIPQARTAYRLALLRDPQSPRALEGIRTLHTN